MTFSTADWKTLLKAKGAVLSCPSCQLACGTPELSKSGVILELNRT